MVRTLERLSGFELISTDERPELSIVVPVYGSAGTLDKLHRRIADAMSSLGVPMS